MLVMSLLPAFPLSPANNLELLVPKEDNTWNKLALAQSLSTAQYHCSNKLLSNCIS